MDCIFCKIISGKIPTKLLSQTSSSISFLDAFPLAKGQNTDLFSLVHQMTSKIDSISGSTLIAIHNGEDAGQEVPHVHVHLVPRSKNDSAGTIHSMFDSSLTLSKDEVEELYNKLKI